MAHPAKLTGTDQRTLINFLKSFYSTGQLQIIYATLTDRSPIPDLPDWERQARIDAIRVILNLPEPVVQQAEPVKPKSKKKK